MKFPPVHSRKFRGIAGGRFSVPRQLPFAAFKERVQVIKAHRAPLLAVTVKPLRSDSLLAVVTTTTTTATTAFTYRRLAVWRLTTLAVVWR
jgi:hypothetical protein